MGSDNYKQRHSKPSGALMCRIFVALLGIALLIYATVRCACRRDRVAAFLLSLCVGRSAAHASRGARAQSDAPVVATQPEASRTPRKLIGDAGKRARVNQGAKAKKRAEVAAAPPPVEAPAVAPAEAPAEADAELEGEAAEADASVGASPPADAQAQPAARGAYRFTVVGVDGSPRPLAVFAGKARGWRARRMRPSRRTVVPSCRRADVASARR